MRDLRLGIVVWCVVVGCSSWAAGQTIAPPRMARDGGRLSAALKAGHESLAGGANEEAAGHFRVALQEDPTRAETLWALVQATADAPDAQRHWAHAWARSVVDVRGRVVLPKDAKEVLPDAEQIVALAQGRALAAKELARYVDKLPKPRRRATGSNAIALWGRELGRLLISDSPLLVDAYAEDLSTAPDDHVPGPMPVLRALEKRLDRAMSGGEWGLAVELARSLYGMASQSAFKDLQGPEPPDLQGLRRAARDKLTAARERLVTEKNEVWTVDQLLELDEVEAHAFSRAHTRWGDPGVAVSSEGRYRIETICGYETLLGVAETIEAHHERLVEWYGQDPFEGQPGLVRVVPEFAGLEAEGAGFWWAGGFQSGDTTTVQFACSTMHDLGRTLTHELTHRFDGAIYPGLPSWLSEGRAVWTGAAYEDIWDDRFMTSYANHGTLESAMHKGYGGRRNLEKLISGTIDDYRDNYVAGHALYVYLQTWNPEGKRLYADRLKTFMETIGDGAREPVVRFTEQFADGAEGRPAGFDAFAREFSTFLSGFYWQDKKPFTKAYTTRRRKPQSRLIYDGETWIFSRNRAEPAFGQDQAARAAALLDEAGDREGAAAAWLWSLHVDEWSAPAADALAERLDGLGLDDAAWCVRRRTALQNGRSLETLGAAPMMSKLGNVDAFVSLMQSTAEAEAASGHVGTAAVLAADGARLAAWLGQSFERPALDETAWTAAFGAWAEIDPSPSVLGSRGWVEDGLTGYEERRVKGLWYESPEGDLHVGRKRPREGTGRLDPEAKQRHAFVRSAAWQEAGRYRVTARVHATTSFIAGALVVGISRRDRNLRVEFSAGDFLYSIGRTETAAEFDSVRLSVSGLRRRNPQLEGSERSVGHAFGRELSFFDLEVVVDGAQASCFVDGVLFGQYHTVDGTPIEGAVGFAMRQGAIRVQDAVVQRLDRGGQLRHSDRPMSLALDAAAVLDRRTLLNRTFPGLPAAPYGRLVLWLPTPLPDASEDGDRQLRDAVRAVETAWRDIDRSGLPFPLAIAIPSSADDAWVAALRAELDVEDEPPLTLLRHAWSLSVPDDPGVAGEAEPMLLFVDSARAVRDAVYLFAGSIEQSSRLRRWLEVFAGRAPATEEAPSLPVDGDGDGS